MQGSYSFNPSTYLQGQKVDTMFDYVTSHPAAGPVEFGYGVISSSQRANGARTPARNKATITFSVDLITANVVNGSINGTAIAPVTYATSHAATMAAIATAIGTVLTALGLTGTATVSGDVITVLLTGSEQTSLLLTAWAVTAGSSQPTTTLAHTTDGFFRGIALQQQKNIRSDNTHGYANTESISVLRRGRVAVLVTETVAENDDAYVVLATSGSEGKLCKTSTGNLATGGKFVTGATVGNLAVLELNLP